MNKFEHFTSNFSLVLLSNAISLIISIVTTLIIPKLLGIEEYSFWQLYLFYTSYTLCISIGWCDGIYLKYGGAEYKSLNKKAISTQFYMLLIYEIFASIVIYFVAAQFIEEQDKIFVLMFALLSGIIGVMRGTLIYILQATNKMKTYAKIIMTDRIIFLLLMLGLILLGYRSFFVLIFADITAKAIALIASAWKIKECVHLEFIQRSKAFSETKELIGIGIKMLAANLSSLLIIGIVRFAIEQNWGTTVFGKVSLTLSISNMFTVFVGAVSVVLFPTLRRMAQENLPRIYSIMRNCLMLPLMGVLILYLPLRDVLTSWLPQYADSIKYMAMLLPICVYETKMNMLINTYMKTLRLEKWIMITNASTVVLSIATTAFTVFALQNLDLAIFSIVVLLAFRCVFAEMILSKKINISVTKDIVLELALTAIFIFTAWILGNSLGTIIYAIAFSIYIAIKYRDIRNTLKEVKKMMGKSDALPNA